MQYSLAGRMENVKASDIREILKIIGRPGLISFAGGLPPASLFPTEELARLAGDILVKHGGLSLQYAPTEGYVPLREWIVKRLNGHWGMEHIELDNVIITSGSQSGLDLTAKLFINEGDWVFAEAPTYMAALAAFNLCGARFMEMECDDNGVIIDKLEAKLKEHKPKFAYVITNSQNPSGRTWSMERRQAFMEVMTRLEIPVVEDNAYYELCFEELNYRSLATFDPKGLVLSIGSFSKVLCPGLRVAWISGPAELIRKLVFIKQATDLQTSYFNQMLVYDYLCSIDFDQRVEMLCSVYRERRDAMLNELDAKALPGMRYTRPKGGMFLWAEFPEAIDTHQFLNKCIERNVAFVPGRSFYPQTQKNNMARLNFSCMAPELIHKGIRIMCEAASEELDG